VWRRTIVSQLSLTVRQIAGVPHKAATVNAIFPEDVLMCRKAWSEALFFKPLVLSVISLSLAGGASIARASDVVISDSQVAQLDISLIRVKPAAIEPVAVLPGTVVPASNARITAAAPFAGTVLKVEALPGQIVRKGDPLITVLSRDLVEAHSNLAQQEAELQRVAAVAGWKRDLANKKILSMAIADEAEATLRKTEVAISAQKRAFSIGDITMGDAGRYTIVAPADGKIVIASVQPGSHVDAMAAAVTISTSDDLWIEAQLPADLVQQVRPGDTVQITETLQGTVLSVGGTLDSMTRSATLLAVVPSGSALIAGQLVSITLNRRAETGSYEVPAAAVAWINNAHAVFARNKAGFALTPIVLKGKSRASATVTGALAPDQEIAASGLPQLEALLQGE
jgi:membrane fusion protein, heavy metal efflux system